MRINLGKYLDEIGVSCESVSEKESVWFNPVISPGTIKKNKLLLKRLKEFRRELRNQRLGR